MLVKCYIDLQQGLTTYKLLVIGYVKKMCFESSLKTVH